MIESEKYANKNLVYREWAGGVGWGGGVGGKPEAGKSCH